MIRRTYRSKKDAGGGLDPKDMLNNMDEKDSVFDAFYIQNIKQTKREQSCMGASNSQAAGANRVRKRKYVKRLVHEVEQPPRESLSGSVFLTPDKSLHVNKGLDLFDLLLNSSPAMPEAKATRKEDLFVKLTAATPKQTKSYGRKKTTAAKKFNYSNSSSSASDKENSFKCKDNLSQNVTDIGSHELVIEKETKLSPKLDESINNIVRKLTLINNIKNRSSGSLKRTFKCNKNRLTRNLPSQVLNASPLSSTPLTEKSRSKSIYKFSPIPMGDLEESPNYVTITEDDNDNEADKSIVFIPKNNSNSLKKSQNEHFISHVTHLSKDNVSKDQDSKPLFSSEYDSHNDSSKKTGISTNDLYKQTDEPKMNELSSIQTSETEPLLGFNIDKIDKDLSVEEDRDNSIIISTGVMSKNYNKSKECNKIVEAASHPKENKYISDVNTSIIEYTVPAETFPGLAEHNNCENVSKGEASVINVLADDLTEPSQTFFGFTEAKTIVNHNNAHEETVTSQNLEPDEQSITSSSDSTQDTDRLSLYDTCNSEDNSSEKQAIVVLSRMDMNLFNKYLKALPQVDSESEDTGSYENENEEFSDNYTSIKDPSETDQQSTSSSTESDVISAQSGSESSEDIRNLSERETMYEHRRSNDNRITSFVTTRRRNDFTNNSTILVLDDSHESCSENDKTVLSNKIYSNSDSDSPSEDLKKTALNMDVTIIKNDNVNEASVPETTQDCIKSSEEKITLRNSKMFDRKTYFNLDASKSPETKPIILQPGKKWERSLSIYRRMTMANDHSILEDEDLQTKGRKYRMSVITTMEMQDQSSLHNESFHNRGSTFIPKPSRSTIRIVKESCNPRLSLSSSTIYDELKGFLEDCDDTIIELSKLSLADDHEVTVVDNFHEDSRLATARDYVLRRCSQTDTLPFDECYPDSVLKNCRKIGEGVYGEVFLWRAPDGRARVMKVVPIAGDVKVNGETQKHFDEIIAEIVIAMELSALRAPIAEIECHLEEGKDVDELDLHSVENATDVFNEVLAVRCVYGAYPSRLLDLWELFDECRGSENDNPAVLPSDQQYIVLELANAGQDLESFQFNSAEQAHALFLQVAFALAVGEEAYQFEHRDLHWGNVLIAPTDQKYATFVIRGRAHRVPRRGVAATIIDYSLSRVSLALGCGGCGGARCGGCKGCGGGAALYNDLAADEGLFAAVGDYQFEVYRLMREKLGNDWKNFEPYTNILWLHYTADKMITALRYKRPTTKTHKQYINKLKAIKQRILSYHSAAQFVLTDNE